MQQQARHPERVFVRAGLRDDEALEDGRHRAQVPLVVELDGRRGHEVLGDLVVERHLKADQLGQHGLNPLVEGLKAAAHDVRVDIGEHLGRGERRRERAEVALHAILDVERARGWVHGRDHQRVVDALHAETLEVIEAAVVCELVQKRDGRLVAVRPSRR